MLIAADASDRELYVQADQKTDDQKTDDQKTGNIALDHSRVPSLLQTSLLALAVCFLLLRERGFLMMAAFGFVVLGLLDVQDSGSSVSVEVIVVGVVSVLLTLFGVSRSMRLMFLVPAVLALCLNALLTTWLSASFSCAETSGSFKEHLRTAVIVSGVLLLITGSSTLFHDTIGFHSHSFAQRSAFVQMAIGILLVLLFAVFTNSDAIASQETQAKLAMATGMLVTLLIIPRIREDQKNNIMVGDNNNFDNGKSIMKNGAIAFVLLSVYLSISYISDVHSGVTTTTTTTTMTAIVNFTSAVTSQLAFGSFTFYPHLALAMVPHLSLLVPKKGCSGHVGTDTSNEASGGAGGDSAEAGGNVTNGNVTNDGNDGDFVVADASISRRCLKESPENMTMCVAAHTNKCKKSYCMDTQSDLPLGVQMGDPDNRNVLALQCHAHLRAFRAASKAVDSGTATPGQRFCVTFHSLDDCVEMCDSYWRSSADPLTAAALQRMESRLDIIDDSLLFMTPEEWVQRQTGSRA